jgi:hypothetical protein
MRLTLRSVGKDIARGAVGIWPGTSTRASASSQAPLSSLALPASIRSIILSFGPMRKTVSGPVVNTRPRIITPVAWRIAIPPARPVLSPWRSQSWPPFRASGPPPESRKLCSSVSARANSAAETGLTAPMPKMPMAKAHRIGPSRNCQAESPAARATTSSDERLRRQKAQIPPSRTAKGRISSTAQGTRSAAISTIRPKVAFGREAERRSSSRKSNSETRPVRPASTAMTETMNRRLM